MRIEGRRDFAAAREDVFDALVDPELIAGTMPGLERLDLSGPDRWTGTIKLSVAPRMKVSFEIREQRRPEHARLHARGKGLGAGITLDTSFDLAGPDGRTSMRYVADFSLSGMLGRLGEATLRPIAERQVGKLLRAVEDRVGGPQ
ncbi:MAG: CoxG family protein [Gaiellaceae bacterium]